jgi:hypothetical protein
MEQGVILSTLLKSRTEPRSVGTSGIGVDDAIGYDLITLDAIA